MGGLCLLASYPKSGNTWMRLALESLEHSGAPVNLGLKVRPWWQSSGVELIAGIISNREWLDEYVGVESSELTETEIDGLRGSSIRQMLPDIQAGYADRPCFMKVHDAWQTTSGQLTFPPEAISQVIYIVRDPRDVVSSFADHMGKTLPMSAEMMANPKLTLAKQEKRATTQLPQHLSSWSGHVSGWLGCGLPLLLVRYEDMIADMAHELRRVADFVGLEVADATISRAVAETQFDKLQKSEAKTGFRERSHHSKRFFRKGKAGAWHTDLPPELVAKIEHDHGAVMRRLGYLPETV